MTRVIRQQNTGNIFVNVYRVIKREDCAGKKYSIKGLYTLLNSNGFSKEDISREVQEDLNFYEKYRERKKREWETKKSKLEEKAKISEQVL